MEGAPMAYRRLGASGLKVSELSYGAWANPAFGAGGADAAPAGGAQAAADALVAEALRGQVNFFDNAEAYGHPPGQAEEIFGQTMRNLGLKRSDLVLSTKIFWGGDGPNAKGLSRKHIIEGTQASLGRLGTDYVDLLFCHRPDLDTPIEETVRAMNHCIDRGWAFYWGTSEWSASQIQEAWDVAERLDLIGPTMEQPHYNLFERQKVDTDYLPLYEKYGLGLTTWSPLASGVLTGKYSGTAVPEGSRLALKAYANLANIKLVQKRAEIDQADRLKPIAEDLGCSLAQLSVAWCLSNKNVSSVILGASRPSQLTETLASRAVVPKLTPDILARIEAALVDPEAL